MKRAYNKRFATHTKAMPFEAASCKRCDASSTCEKPKGSDLTMGAHSKDDRPLSAEALVRAYRQEADRQKLLVKKAQLTENRLLFVVSALRKLFGDENFVTLLRAEGLDSLPAYLAGRIQDPQRG